MKKTLCLITVLLSLAGIKAEHVIKGDLIFYIEDGYASVHNNNISVKSVSIPSTITHDGRSYLVTEIEDKAFALCSDLVSITIPKTIKRIKNDAFHDCSSLKSISIPDNVTVIEMSTFRGCTMLTHVRIPKTIREIKQDAFSGCENLTIFTIPEGVTTIEEHTFSGCKNLKSISIPQTVRDIKRYAFSGCENLKTFIIPDGVATIEEYTFSGCIGLETISLPNSLTKIESDAFSSSDLKNIFCEITEPLEIDNSVFKNYQATLHTSKNSTEKYKTADYWKYFFIDENIKLSKKYHNGYFDPKQNNLDKYDIKGVMADGKSELNISTDFNFDDITYYEISITANDEIANDVGNYSELKKDENGNCYFIYTAPENYPEGLSQNEYSVNVKFKISYDSNNEVFAFGQTNISIIRPPVLMTHGLNDDSFCFGVLHSDLIYKHQLYQPFQTIKADYSYSNKDYFRNNLYVIKNHLDILFLSCLKNGYVGTKADLIGHSMGGILSRLHAQYVNKNDVNKIITLNTPHSGSQGANLIVDDRKFPLSLLASLGSRINFGDWKTGAIEDLQVNNYIIDHYLNHRETMSKMADIPVHAVCTTIENKPAEALDAILTKVNKKYALIKFLLLFNGNRFVGDGSEGIISALYDGEMSDMVVALSSQKGGLPEENVSYFNGQHKNFFHSFSPNNVIAVDRIIELLTKPKSDYSFSHTGFNPPVLSYPFAEVEKPKEKRQARLTYNTKDSHLSLTGKIIKNAEGQYVEASFDTSDDIITKAFVGILDEDQIFVYENDTLSIKLDDTYSGELKLYAIGKNENEEYKIDSLSFSVERISEPLYIRYTNQDTLYIPVGNHVIPEVICGWSNNTETLALPNFSTISNSINIQGRTITALDVGSGMLYANMETLTDSIPFVVIPFVEHSYTDIETNTLENDQAKIHISYSLSDNSLIIKYLNDYEGIQNIGIYNISGQLIKQEVQNVYVKANGIQYLDVSGLPSSVYIILIQTKDDKCTSKFIVN